MGLLVAIIALFALIVAVIRWAIGKQDRLRWRLLGVFFLLAGVVLLYAGA